MFLYVRNSGEDTTIFAFIEAISRALSKIEQESLASQSHGMQEKKGMKMEDYESNSTAPKSRHSSKSRQSTDPHDQGGNKTSLFSFRKTKTNRSPVDPDPERTGTVPPENEGKAATKIPTISRTSSSYGKKNIPMLGFTQMDKPKPNTQNLSASMPPQISSPRSQQYDTTETNDGEIPYKSSRKTSVGEVAKVKLGRMNSAKSISSIPTLPSETSEISEPLSARFEFRRTSTDMKSSRKNPFKKTEDKPTIKLPSETEEKPSRNSITRLVSNKLKKSKSMASDIPEVEKKILSHIPPSVQSVHLQTQDTPHTYSEAPIMFRQTSLANLQSIQPVFSKQKSAKALPKKTKKDKNLFNRVKSEKQLPKVVTEMGPSLPSLHEMEDHTPKRSRSLSRPEILHSVQTEQVILPFESSENGPVGVPLIPSPSLPLQPTMDFQDEQREEDEGEPISSKIRSTLSDGDIDSLPDARKIKFEKLKDSENKENTEKKRRFSKSRRSRGKSAKRTTPSPSPRNSSRNPLNLLFGKDKTNQPLDQNKKTAPPLKSKLPNESSKAKLKKHIIIGEESNDGNESKAGDCDCVMCRWEAIQKQAMENKAPSPEKPVMNRSKTLPSNVLRQRAANKQWPPIKRGAVPEMPLDTSQLKEDPCEESSQNDSIAELRAKLDQLKLVYFDLMLGKKSSREDSFFRGESNSSLSTTIQDLLADSECEHPGELSKTTSLQSLKSLLSIGEYSDILLSASKDCTLKPQLPTAVKFNPLHEAEESDYSDFEYKDISDIQNANQNRNSNYI